MLPDIVRRVDRRQPACRSALPQAAFLPRKNSAGLFGEGKSDDDKEENRRNTCVFQGSMTQSALICTWGPRKVARPCGVRRTHHSGEGCPLGSARLKRRLRPTKKRVCPCQTKVPCKKTTKRFKSSPGRFTTCQAIFVDFRGLSFPAKNQMERRRSADQGQHRPLTTDRIILLTPHGKTNY